MNWNDIFEYRDGELYWKIKTAKNVVVGKKAGWKTHGYRRCMVNKKSFYLHRIIWEMFNGEIDPGMVIDHIDGNGLNNRLNNLRVVSQQKNICNQKKRVDNKSGFSGVIWNKEKQKWTAYITIIGKRKTIGHFNEKELAISARKKMEIKHEFHPMSLLA